MDVFNEHKFRELVLYIASQCQDDILWGATKLNKQLFFSDFLTYLRLGQPITGADYMALDYGPAPRRLLPIRAGMLEDGDCLLEIHAHQERLVALREPDRTVFSESELAIVDEVIEALRGTTADAVSELSHRFGGWSAAIAESRATGMHISIPYETAFVGWVTPDEDTVAEGLRLADKYEWPV